MESIGKLEWDLGGMLLLVLAGGLFHALREPVGDSRSRTPGDRCALHDVVSETDVVPIAYGLLFNVSGHYEARKADFPNDNLSVAGGCMLGEVQKAWVKFCPACRVASMAWTPPLPKARPTGPKLPLTKAPAPAYR